MSVDTRRVIEQGAPPAPGSRDHTARSGRSLLLAVARSALAWAAAQLGAVGRLSLYIGLFLVALGKLRLPGEMGSIADAFLLASMVCALLMMAQGRPLRIGVLKAHFIGLALLIAGVVLATLAGTSSDDWESLLQLSKLIFATTATIIACMVLLERRSQLKTALGCWVVSAAISSAAALLQAALGEDGRLSGLSPHVNHLGAVAGMAIGGALCLAALSDRVQRLLWLLAALLCIFGVVASASRAGAIISIVSLGIWSAMFYRMNRELTILVLGFCLAGAAVANFAFVEIWSGRDVGARLASATDPYADGAVRSRLHQYEDTLRDALQDPLLGVGLARADRRVGDNVIHNTFLMLFRSGGLLALAGIIIILADLLYKAIVTYSRAGSPKTRGLIVGLLTGTLGLILDGMVEPVLYQRMYWVPSALLLAFIACRDQARRPLRNGRRKGKKSRRRASAEVAATAQARLLVRHAPRHPAQPSD
jgi:O-antigen ligase